MKTFKKVISFLMAVFLMFGSLTLPAFPVYAATETVVTSKPWAVTYYYFSSYYTSDNGVGGKHRHASGESPRTYASGTLTIYKSVDSSGNVVLRADFGHATGTFSTPMESSDAYNGWWDGSLNTTISGLTLKSNGWSTSNGTISSSSDLSITATTVGTYTFSYTYSTYSGADVYWGQRKVDKTDTISVTLTSSDFSPVINSVSQTIANATSKNLTVAAIGGSGGYTYSMNGGTYQSLNTYNVSKNGTYSFVVKDSNNKTSPAYSVTVSDIKPNITAVTPTWDGNTNTTAITISATDNGSTPYTYSMNGGAYQSSNVFSVSKNGTYTFTVKDSLGNVSAQSAVTVNSIKPVINVVTETHNTDSVTLTVVSTDNGSTPYTYSMNGGAYQSSNAFVITKNGSYDFYAKDSNGNVSDVSTLVVDDIKPIILSVTANPSGLTNSDKIALCVNAVCGTTPYYYTMDGSDFQNSNLFYVTDNGTYTFTVYDSDSLVSETYSFTVDNIDRTYPVISSIEMDMTNFWDTTGVNYIVTATDDHDIQYSSDGATYKDENTFNITSCGNYVFHVKDEAGNDTKSNVYPIYFDKDGAIKYLLKFENVLDAEGHVCKVNVTVVTPNDGTKLMYSYDGSDYGTGFIHSYDTNGSHSVTIMDNYGNKVTANFVLDSIYSEAELLNSVKEKINSIGTVTYTDACKARIDEARSAYDALNNSQKAKISNYSKLTDAEAEYERLKAEAEKAESDRIAADEVKALIDVIGNVDLSEDSRKKIEDARSAYNNLTEDQKKLVDNYSKLTKAEADYEKLLREKAEKEKTEADQNAANAVIEKINSIGTVTYTDECKVKIDDARKAYDALSQTQKGLVTNYKTLTDAEAEYARLKNQNNNSSGNNGNSSGNNTANTNQSKANDVIAKINDIGTVTYTDACKQRIDKARRAYDLLTADQKALVTNYATLVYDEELYESLKPTNTNPSNPGNVGVSTYSNGNNTGNTPSSNTVISNNGGAGSQESQIPSDPNSITEFSARYATDAPLINCVSHSFNSPTNIQEVVLCVDATDAKGHTSGLQYSIDGIEWQKDSTFKVEYESEYTVYVKDRYSNMSSEVHAVPIVKPAILGVDQVTEGYGKSVLTIKAEGGEGLEYSLNNSEWTSENVFTITENGTVTVAVRNADGFEISMEVEIYTVKDAPVENSVPEKTLADTIKEAAIDYWWVAIIVLFTVGGGVALKMTSSKKKKEVVS